MTTYRQYQDTRDGHIYNCVQMPDGKWWSAENLAWGGGGLPPGGNTANVKTHGYLYLCDNIPAAVPPGAHAPTRSELKDMLNSLGLGVVDDGGGIPATISSALLSDAYGGVDYFGFSALKSGRIYLGSADEFGYASWIGAYSQNGQFYFFAQIKASGGAFTQGSPSQNAFSVRFIVDVFNEPPPKPSDFFPPPGTYDNPTTVTLNKSGMRYTIDGTDPAETSPFLDIPLRISGPTEIRLKSDAMPTVYSFAYLIKGRALPMYKQAALWADGKTSPESITRTYHG